MLELKTSSVITRYPGNPVLSAKDVPYDATLVFNAGVTKFRGRYVMMFRNDYGFDETRTRHSTNMGLAYSEDGLHWQVTDKPCFAMSDNEITRVYDPRLTVIDDRCYVCFAVDTRHGVCGGVAVTENFEHFEVLSISAPDNRNMVLFPEKVNGKYVRLERPFPVYSRGGGERFDIWMSDSPDLKYWGNTHLVLGCEQVPYANAKIGPGAPPIKTERGWLAVIHAVDIDPTRKGWGWAGNWTKRYTAGLMLLDLENPAKVIGLSREPLLAPEPQYDYEAHGFRDYTIFPGGMILEDDGTVKIYYGAADTVECLATAKLEDLLSLCKPL